jgi:two-component system, NarL family, nitrate/nitrite sensor histidine kinase NarX
MLTGLQKHISGSDRNKTIGLLVLIVFLLAVIIWLGVVFGWLIGVVLLAGLGGWGLAYYLRTKTRDGQQALNASRDQFVRSERRTHALLRLNHSMAEASAGIIDERAFMESALEIIDELVNGLGCSFVPIDEWKQPLPAFTHGKLPNAILSAWAAQLASGMLRERCGNCKVLESTPGACPLHPAQLGDSLTVYCVPLESTGVLHLYLPLGTSLDLETREFLDNLLVQVSLTYSAARLRQQEQVTLRQLHMLHAPEGDFSASLGVMLQGLVHALEVDFALVRVRSGSDERHQSALNIQCGDSSSLTVDQIEQMVTQALAGVQPGSLAEAKSETLPTWLALPLALPEGFVPEGSIPNTSRGILLVCVNRPYDFHPRQRVILQAVASQVALLVENEHLIRSLEYKIVIQERARLAREIHDGLAQTLAFLKLQASQMQTYLAQGDLARLSRILKENYQVLAEAYLDTRQAIDDLRLTPQDGLETWLEHVLGEFESSSGLEVERDIHLLSRKLAPEVQAQLVRIVQEALSNVRKHAHAHQVWVKLVERQGEIILEVCDDGQGFATEDVPVITRHGLRGMRERANMLGADFQIISQAFQGTTMRLVLPASVAEEPSI